MVYKWCVVPLCKNTSIKTPDKIFVSIPTNTDTRKKWLTLAYRNPKDIGATSNAFMCEDHFDIEKDMANYRQYKMGFSRFILKVEGAMPSKFDCQMEIRKRLSEVTGSTLTSRDFKKCSKTVIDKQTKAAKDASGAVSLKDENSMTETAMHVIGMNGSLGINLFVYKTYIHFIDIRF